MKVLLVEDAALVRARLAAMLGEIAGVEVVGVESTAQALASLSPAPDVVVLDVQLRGESGLTIAPAVKRVCPGAVLVVFTNHADRAHERESRALGADHFLDKSTDFDALLGIVEGVAATRRPTAPGATS